MNQYNIAICTYSRNSSNNISQIIDDISSSYNNTKIFSHSLANTAASLPYQLETSTVSNIFDRVNEILLDTNIDIKLKKTIINNMNTMYAIHNSIYNKKQYELSNNMRFDLVYVIDTAINQLSFVNERNITPNIPAKLDGIIRGQVYKNKKDFGLFGLNASFLFGESRYIDIVGSMFNFYQNNSLWEIIRANDLGYSIKSINIDSLLWKWLSIRNISMENIAA